MALATYDTELVSSKTTGSAGTGNLLLLQGQASSPELYWDPLHHWNGNPSSTGGSGTWNATGAWVNSLGQRYTWNGNMAYPLGGGSPLQYCTAIFAGTPGQVVMQSYYTSAAEIKFAAGSSSGQYTLYNYVAPR